MPPEYVEAGSSARCSSPTCSSRPAAALRAAAPLRPARRAKNTAFSRAVSVGYTAISCGTRPIAARTARFSVRRSWPAILISPAS
jgi:hypothetical protein